MKNFIQRISIFPLVSGPIIRTGLKSASNRVNEKVLVASAAGRLCPTAFYTTAVMFS